MTDIEPARCKRCGWPLVESVEKGCVAGNCSYRPEDGSDEWHRMKRRDAELRDEADRELGRNLRALAMTGCELVLFAADEPESFALQVISPECARVYAKPTLDEAVLAAVRAAEGGSR